MKGSLAEMRGFPNRKQKANNCIIFSPSKTTTMISYKVTNDKRFRKVEDIDTSLLSAGYMYNNPANTYFSGTLMISAEGGKHHIITGQHSANDYQDDFGFVLTFTED